MLKRLLIQGKRSQDRAWGEDLISCCMRMRCAICPLHADARGHMPVSGDRGAGSLEGIYWKNFPNMEKSGNRALSPVGGPPCSHRLFAIDKCSHKKKDAPRTGAPRAEWLTLSRSKPCPFLQFSQRDLLSSAE